MLNGLSSLALRLRRDRSGATAIEYALLAALIAVAIVTAAGSVGRQLSAGFSRVAASFDADE